MINFNPDNSYSLCALGEFLRDQFFDQSKGYGCYRTFKLNKGIFSTTEQRDMDWGEIETVNCAAQVIPGFGLVKMEYYWDGDGYLSFEWVDKGIKIENTDCKKDYEWKLIK